MKGKYVNIFKPIKLYPYEKKIILLKYKALYQLSADFIKLIQNKLEQVPEHFGSFCFSIWAALNN